MAATPPQTNVTPVRAETLVTPGDGNEAYVQLSPRYTQPARLDFALLSATDDTVRSTSGPISKSVLLRSFEDDLTI